jgi:hypothetical protein
MLDGKSERKGSAMTAKGRNLSLRGASATKQSHPNFGIRDNIIEPLMPHPSQPLPLSATA